MLNCNNVCVQNQPAGIYNLCSCHFQDFLKIGSVPFLFSIISRQMKMNLDSFTSSRLIIDLNIKSKILKLQKEIQENIFPSLDRQVFVKIIQKALQIKYLTLSKFKTSANLKIVYKNEKASHRLKENICMHIF